MAMNFIDISSWQKGLDLETLFAKNENLHGAIVKATGGASYVNEYCDPWVQVLIKLGRPWGFYHYLNDDGRYFAPEKEAEFFVNNCLTYFGKGIPFADYEGTALSFGTNYLRTFLDRVYELTGIKAVVYCSLSVVQSQNFRSIADSGYSLWVAQYADMKYTGIQENPWQSGSVSPFNGYMMHQYSSRGRLPGWDGNLDLDKFYGDLEDWNRFAGGGSAPIPDHKEVSPKLVMAVFNGEYGIGEERRKKLIEQGYDYDAVQAKINELYGIAPDLKKVVSKVSEYFPVLVNAFTEFKMEV